METNKHEKKCNYCLEQITINENEPAVCSSCKNALLPKVHKFSRKQFVITHDHLSGEIINEVSTVLRLKELGYNTLFKLFDDDDILYYSGRLHDDCEDEFCALDWGMSDSGTTYCKIKNKRTGVYEHL